MSEDGAVVFEFKGQIYVRPLGRGIVLYRPDRTQMDAQLEDSLTEGEYEMTIQVRLPAHRAGR